MNAELLHILQHSLGCDEHGRGRQYRNHFVTDPTSADGKLCLELVGLGLMLDRGPQTLAAGMHCFCVTEQGKVTMAMNSPQPPKISPGRRRYLVYLSSADAFGSPSFGDWLKRGLYRRCA